MKIFKKDQLEFIKKSPFKNIGVKDQQTIEEIYTKANGSNLNGKDILEFSRKVKTFKNKEKSRESR